MALCSCHICLARQYDFTAVRAEVDFSRKLRVRDGFGNCVIGFSRNGPQNPDALVLETRGP